jgi:hypothetical protein
VAAGLQGALQNRRKGGILWKPIPGGETVAQRHETDRPILRQAPGREGNDAGEGGDTRKNDRRERA